MLITMIFTDSITEGLCCYTTRIVTNHFFLCLTAHCLSCHLLTAVACSNWCTSFHYTITQLMLCTLNISNTRLLTNWATWPLRGNCIIIFTIKLQPDQNSSA